MNPSPPHGRPAAASRSTDVEPPGRSSGAAADVEPPDRSSGSGADGESPDRSSGSGADVEPPAGRTAVRLASFVGWCTCVAHILGLVGDHVWQFDLLSHFVVQYAMVFLVVSAVIWRYRGFRAARSFVLLLLMMTVLAGVSWIPQPERRLDATVPRSERLRLASLNVLTENDRHAAVGARLAEIDADVVLLLEVSPAWLDGLGALRSTYPHRLEAPRRDNFGIALWSRVPWKSAELLDEGGEVVPSVRAVIPIGGRDVEVRGVHALPPVGARWSALRDRQILAVAQGALATHRPVVLAGDLNLTPWSAVFDRLTWSTGLRDTRRGFGVQATWPGYLPMPFRIPIDHVLVSRELAWRDRSVFEAPGSDHLGVVVELGWRRPSSR